MYNILQSLQLHRYYDAIKQADDALMQAVTSQNEHRNLARNHWKHRNNYDTAEQQEHTDTIPYNEYPNYAHNQWKHRNNYDTAEQQEHAETTPYNKYYNKYRNNARNQWKHRNNYGTSAEAGMGGNEYNTNDAYNQWTDNGDALEQAVGTHGRRWENANDVVAHSQYVPQTMMARQQNAGQRNDKDWPNEWKSNNANANSRHQRVRP